MIFQKTLTELTKAMLKCIYPQSFTIIMNARSFI